MHVIVRGWRESGDDQVILDIKSVATTFHTIVTFLSADKRLSYQNGTQFVKG
jgi:hypothetical protein